MVRRALVIAVVAAGELAGCRCGRDRGERGQGALAAAATQGPSECARVGWRAGPSEHLCLEDPGEDLAFLPMTAHDGRVRLVFRSSLPWLELDAPWPPIVLTSASGAPMTLRHDAHGPLAADGSALRSYAIVDVTPAGVEYVADTACPPSGDDELVAVAFDGGGDLVGLCGEPRIGAPLAQVVLRDGRLVPPDRPAVPLRLPPDPDLVAPTGSREAKERDAPEERLAPDEPEHVFDLRLFATARAQYVAFQTSRPGVKLPERTSWLQPLVPGAVAIRADLLDRSASLGPEELAAERTPVAVLAIDGDLVAVVEVADVDVARTYRFLRLPPRGAPVSLPAPPHRLLAGCESDVALEPRPEPFEQPWESARATRQGGDLVLRLPVPFDQPGSEQLGATIEYRLPGAVALPGFDAVGDLDPSCTTVDVPGEDSYDALEHLVASCDRDACVAVYERAHPDGHGRDLHVRRWTRAAPAPRDRGP